MTAFSPSANSSQRDLAVAWMNRGHALMLQGDPASLASALEAYNEAIARLRPLLRARADADPSWINSLGAALMNRGHLLHRVHGTAQATVALESFDEAVAALRSLVPDSASTVSPSSPWPRRNLAGTLLNRANLLLDLSRFDEALAAAREALEFAAPSERLDAVDADLALKARRALCDAIGRQIVAHGADQETLAAAASDLVDDALALARHWIAQGENAFQPLALRFFRYGTQLYRLHQPHFLAEFIQENLPATPGEFHAIAREAIDAALADRPRDRAYLVLGDPASERHVRTSRELEKLRAFLAS